MKTGKPLIAEIDSTRLGKTRLALWWLGQHSFIVKTPGGVIYLDPFLTDMPQRLVPPLLSPADITNASIIAGTHDHGDHIDRPTWPVIAKASPAARFMVPDLLKTRLAREIGIPARRFVGMDDGRTIDLAGIRISAIASAHEFLDRDKATGRYPHLGYIIEANGRTIYHAGDCCIYEGLVTKLLKWRFDAMILPINGRDAARLSAGCIGNMTYQEAADLAGAVGTRLVIPAHYDMFAMNLGSPSDFAAYVSVKYPKMQVRICEYGERFTI